MTVFAAYFDASRNGDFFTVGALLFRRKHVKQFEREWRSILTKYDIPYFHMADCNARRGEYARLSEQECIDCATSAINAVADYAAKGATWTVNINDFDEVVGKAGFLPSALVACAYPAMMDLMNWANENQGDVTNLLNAISEDGGRRERFRYEGHDFLPKDGSLPTQGADIVAWHGSKHARRRNEGVERLRGDFNALVNRVQITDGIQTREFLQGMMDMTVKKTGVPYGPELAQLSLLMNKSNLPRLAERVRALAARNGTAKKAAKAKRQNHP